MSTLYPKPALPHIANLQIVSWVQKNNLPKEGDKGIGTQLARAAEMPGQAHCINPL